MFVTADNTKQCQTKKTTLKKTEGNYSVFFVRMGEIRGVYRVLVWKPEGKRLLERPRRRWENNIKMLLHEVGWDKDWIDLA